MAEVDSHSPVPATHEDVAVIDSEDHDASQPDTQPEAAGEHEVTDVGDVATEEPSDNVSNGHTEPGEAKDLDATSVEHEVVALAENARESPTEEPKPKASPVSPTKAKATTKVPAAVRPAGKAAGAPPSPLVKKVCI